MAAVAATTGLALTAVVAASAAVAIFASTYLGGMVLGVGIMGTAWVLSTSLHRLAPRRGRSLGRSRTQDCRQARWTRPADPVGAPHPPTEAQRRVRPCTGSRRL